MFRKQKVVEKIEEFKWDDYETEKFLGEVERRPMMACMAVKYDGEWKLGTNVKHGRGVTILDDGHMYEGYYLNGKENGKGRCIYNNGTYIESGFLNGKPFGEGKCLQIGFPAALARLQLYNKDGWLNYLTDKPTI